MSRSFFVNVLFLLSLVACIKSQAFAVLTKEQEDTIESMRQWFCPKQELEKKRVEIGFKHLGNLDGVSELELFNKGISLRKGEVKGLEDESIERLMFQYICFKSVRTFEDNLHRRAMHNQASTAVALADKIKKLSEDPKQYNQVLPTLYQEAWYLFSLANLPPLNEKSESPSKVNLKRLVENKSIDFVIDNPQLDEKFGKQSYAEAREEIFKEHFKEQEKKIKQDLLKVNDLAQEFTLEFFKSMGIENKVVTNVLNTEEAKTKLKSFEEKQLEEMQKGLEHIKTEAKIKILDKPIDKLEKELSEKKTFIEKLTFDKQTLNSLVNLFSQLIVTIKTTPQLLPNEEHPTIVWIGRSVSWPAVVQEYLKEQLPKNWKFKHAMVSGLRNEPYTTAQQVGYKRYLDSLGFKTLSKKSPVLIVDVAETGRSLQRFGELIKQCYNFENIQFISLMFSGQTINLERARVIYLTGKLAEIMFAKHVEKAKFCPFPTLYPDQWENWETYIKDFKPQKDALYLKAQLIEWLKSKEGKDKISPIVSYANDDR